MSNIKEIFNRMLVTHGAEKRDFYFVDPIEENNQVRVGFSPDGFPSLLIITETDLIPLEPINLSGLNATFNLKCLVNTNEDSEEGTFHVITYIEEDIYLRDFFFEFFGDIFSKNTSLSSELLRIKIEHLAQLFSYKKKKSHKTIQGLWAELFIIDIAQDSTTWAGQWPEKTETTFDFLLSHIGVDVKSFAGANRKHFFKYEQLHNQSVEQTIVLSMCVTEDEGGISIFDLYNNIKTKINDDEILEKLRNKIFKLAGDNSPDTQTFNFSIARETLMIVEGCSIPNIQEGSFPSTVTNVTFRSDCSDVPMLPFSEENQTQLLQGVLVFPDH